MDCPKCHGKGWVYYNHYYNQVCDACCPHDLGWLLLEEHYEEDNGKWCCRRGCGTLRDEDPTASA